MAISSTLDSLLPPNARAGLWQRALIVWAVAALITVFQWASNSHDHSLAMSAAYSYAISTCIWLLVDPLRIALHGVLGAPAPHYWATTPRMGLYLFVCIAAGYVAGTLIGDAVSGYQHLSALAQSPQRFLGFWVASFGISLGFLVYFYQRERALELERQATEARLRLLESQLEPHMLFNTLANLKALIGIDPPRAQAMLDHLNAYLRATLGASRTAGPTHTLAQEFARLDDYLALMAIRMGPRLNYTLHLPSTLRDQPVAPLLLQPLVENAIRHGLEPAVLGGAIEVRAEVSAGQMQLDVSDTGMGFTEAAGVTPTGGFGLTQVRERLQTLYGTAASLRLQPGARGGCVATIRYPLDNNR